MCKLEALRGQDSFLILIPDVEEEAHRVDAESQPDGLRRSAEPHIQRLVQRRLGFKVRF